MNARQLCGRAAIVAMSLVMAASCGKSSNPAAPSPGGGSPASAAAGATINGTVSGTTSASSTGLTKLGAGGTITVTIAGTSVTTTVDSSGRFVLAGVPSGTVQLVFTSGGVSATITLNGVQPTDQITLKVTLHGGTATLDTEQRNGASMTEIEDRITAVNPAGTTRTLDVGTTRVSVPVGVTIRHGNETIAFEALKIGDRVHVRGALSGALLVASEVMVQNTNTNVPVNASGSVSSLQAGFSCPAIRFTVDGWVVETSAATDFQKGTCAGIANGTAVHVKGDVQSSGRVLATWVQVGK